MKKTYELYGYVFNNKPDVVILNETWLKHNILNYEIFPKIYKFIRIDLDQGKPIPGIQNSLENIASIGAVF